jgi:PleD family two-component response regulator
VDIPVRYAGDEFVVFLRALDLDPGIEVAERICAAVRAVDLDDVSPGLTVEHRIGCPATRNDR